MSELKSHEVMVKNKAGDELKVSKAYYEANKDKLKMVGKAQKNKMDSASPKNKSSDSAGYGDKG